MTVSPKFAAAAFTAFVSTAAWAGPPYHTDDPEPVELGHLEANNGIGGTWLKGDTALYGPQFDWNYGPAQGVQLKVNAQFSYDKVQGEPSHYGFGDLYVGTKIRFIEEDPEDWTPMVSTYPTIAFATGSLAKGTGTGYTHFLTPIYVQKTIGDWTAFTL